MRLRVLLTIILVLAGFYLVRSQSLTAEAAIYMNGIGQQYEIIRKDTWDYTSSIAHSRSARKTDRKRIDLLNTLDRSIRTVKKMDGFQGDNSLRDSVVAFLNMYFDVLNYDYAKIVDMEAVAEQSYDLMEAFLLANELANEKLEQASNRLDTQYKAFAAKYDVTIVESNDELSRKLTKSTEAMKYHNQVYLIFFKAHKQEAYMLEALQNNDINGIEQNRSSLLSFANEGKASLKELGHHKGDNSINAACARSMDFFADEAETKILVLSDFLLIKEEYEKMAKIIESKDRMLLTNDEVKQYNAAVDAYKKGINEFNSTNQRLNNDRNRHIEQWNNAVNSFMERHVPKR